MSEILEMVWIFSEELFRLFATRFFVPLFIWKSECETYSTKVDRFLTSFIRNFANHWKTDGCACQIGKNFISSKQYLNPIIPKNMRENFSTAEKPKKNPYLKNESLFSLEGKNDFLLIGIIFLLVSFFLLSGFFFK